MINYRQIKRTATGAANRYWPVLTLILSVLTYSITSVALAQNNHYFQIEHGNVSGDYDLGITSVGVLSFENNKVGYVRLSYLKSDIDGNASTLDLGGGFAFSGKIPLYISLGVSLGYNWDNDEYIAAYFPEVGIALNITSHFGITVSGKRYFNLYEVDEDIVMLGLSYRY